MGKTIKVVLNRWVLMSDLNESGPVWDKFEYVAVEGPAIERSTL